MDRLIYIGENVEGWVLSMKVREIINAILTYSCGGMKFERTCDLLISGDYDMEVRGICTTFMATVEVIEKAIKLGVNLIITHEPTYYTSVDKLDWLKNDPIYLLKKKIIDENKIAIWRFHDHMHAAPGDLIYRGLIREIGWENYLIQGEAFPCCYEIPEMSLQELAQFFKQKLKMEVIRVVGSLNNRCKRVGILVGGGSLGLGVEEMPMMLMREQNLDVMVCGEINEWTLCPYVRDASALGMNKALLILGHERTEEFGMKYLAEWLKPLVDDIPVYFIDSKEPFSYI
ncbi:MAG TPA: Nif3-like dinuclear metal center hexameric protein [Tissierellaceae bacterium]